MTETAAAAGSGETGLLGRIAFRNGTVDRASLLNADGADAELLPYDAGNVSEGALSYDYRPEAQCPLWLATLAEIFPCQGNDDHRTDILQEFMGYSLVPDDSSFEKFLIMVGDGSNGKTTILARAEGTAWTLQRVACAIGSLECSVPAGGHEQQTRQYRP